MDLFFYSRKRKKITLGKIRQFLYHTYFQKRDYTFDAVQVPYSMNAQDNASSYLYKATLQICLRLFHQPISVILQVGIIHASTSTIPHASSSFHLFQLSASELGTAQATKQAFCFCFLFFFCSSTTLVLKETTYHPKSCWRHQFSRTAKSCNGWVLPNLY